VVCKQKTGAKITYLFNLSCRYPFEMEKPGPGSAAPGYRATGLAAALCRRTVPIMTQLQISPCPPELFYLFRQHKQFNRNLLPVLKNMEPVSYCDAHF